MSDEEPVVSYPSIPAAQNPAGTPKPPRFTPLWPIVVGGIGTAIVAAGSTLSLIAARPQPLLGSTRSCKLKWEQRQAEIAAAATGAEQLPPAEAPPGDAA